MFGPTRDGLVNLIVTLALVYILIKIPFWVLGQVRGGGRSFLGTLVRGFVAYRLLGLLGGRGLRGGRNPGRRHGPGGPGGGRRGPRPRPAPRGGGGDDPYARPRADAAGQYLLPLTGVRRVRPPPNPAPPAPPAVRPAGGSRRASAGRQLVLPLDGQWPEDRPVLQRDGQYRLPIPVTRVRRPTTAPSPPAAGRAAAGPAGGPARRSGRGRQLEIPFDPYAGLRPDRSGQYRLPLDGLTRVPRPRPAPPPPAPRAPAAPAPGPAAAVRRPARPRQLPLPLDLPHPARRPAGSARPRPPTTSTTSAQSATVRRQPRAAGGGDSR